MDIFFSSISFYNESLNNKYKINKYINQRINSDKFIKKLLNINTQD